MYGFAYDSFGRQTATFLGSTDTLSVRTLSENTYSGKNLVCQTYNNDNYVTFSYDTLDRIGEKGYDGAVAAKYSYDVNGNLSAVRDFTAGVKNAYTYDMAGRLVESYEKSSSTGKTNVATAWKYTNKNTLASISSRIQSIAYDPYNQPYSTYYI